MDKKVFDQSPSFEQYNKDISTLIFPDSLDIEFYRNIYPDLGTLSDAQLRNHYELHGKNEGRVASSVAVRSYFVDLVSKVSPALEIGPFFRPLLKGENVRYFDILDTKQLHERAKREGYSPKDIPDIDYVSPTGDLTIVSDKFSMVFSSHNIEHQPDLISHFNNVSDLLLSGGIYALIIPDKRFCFDHFIAESTVANVMQAHHEKRMLHTLESVVEHNAMTTHNDPTKHWAGDHGGLDVTGDKIKLVLEKWEANKGKYMDVHAWQFTPQSFGDIIMALSSAGIIPFDVHRVYSTPLNQVDFCVVLKKKE